MAIRHSKSLGKNRARCARGRALAANKSQILRILFFNARRLSIALGQAAENRLKAEKEARRGVTRGTSLAPLRIRYSSFHCSRYSNKKLIEPRADFPMQLATMPDCVNMASTLSRVPNEFPSDNKPHAPINYCRDPACQALATKRG